MSVSTSRPTSDYRVFFSYIRTIFILQEKGLGINQAPDRLQLENSSTKFIQKHLKTVYKMIENG